MATDWKQVVGVLVAVTAVGVGAVVHVRWKSHESLAARDDHVERRPSAKDTKHEDRTMSKTMSKPKKSPSKQSPMVASHMKTPKADGSRSTRCDSEDSHTVPPLDRRKKRVNKKQASHSEAAHASSAQLRLSAARQSEHNRQVRSHDRKQPQEREQQLQGNELLHTKEVDAQVLQATKSETIVTEDVSAAAVEPVAAAAAAAAVQKTRELDDSHDNQSIEAEITTPDVTFSDDSAPSDSDEPHSTSDSASAEDAAEGAQPVDFKDAADAHTGCAMHKQAGDEVPVEAAMNDAAANNGESDNESEGGDAGANISEDHATAAGNGGVDGLHGIHGMDPSTHATPTPEPIPAEPTSFFSRFTWDTLPLFSAPPVVPDSTVPFDSPRAQAVRELDNASGREMPYSPISLQPLAGGDGSLTNTDFLPLPPPGLEPDELEADIFDWPPSASANQGTEPRDPGLLRLNELAKSAALQQGSSLFSSSLFASPNSSFGTHNDEDAVPTFLGTSNAFDLGYAPFRSVAAGSEPAFHWPDWLQSTPATLPVVAPPPGLLGTAAEGKHSEPPPARAADIFGGSGFFADPNHDDSLDEPLER